MIPAIHIMNLRTLDLNLLLVFEALMDERNVTRAGQPKEGSRMRLPEQVSKKREVTSSPVAEVMKGQLLGFEKGLLRSAPVGAMKGRPEAMLRRALST